MRRSRRFECVERAFGDDAGAGLREFVHGASSTRLARHRANESAPVEFREQIVDRREAERRPRPHAAFVDDAVELVAVAGLLGDEAEHEQLAVCGLVVHAVTLALEYRPSWRPGRGVLADPSRLEATGVAGVVDGIAD